MSSYGTVSELNSKERKVRNAIMTRAVRSMYGKSTEEIFNGYFRPALISYVNFLKNGGTPDTSKLYNVLHEKASEINKRFVDELHSYVHSNGKLTICGECLPKLTKANYDIMVMCECCHFHTFYTTLFNKNEKGQERFKVYRINFQLASCGFGDSLAYVDGEYIPLTINEDNTVKF